MQRDRSLDIVAGTLIIYIVFGHAVQILNCAYLLEIVSYLNKVFYCMMPWFFFKSGMFSKNNSWDHICSKINRLLRPFIVYSVFGVVVYWFDLLVCQKDFNWVHYFLTPLKGFVMTGAMHGNLPLWFLTTMILMYLILFCLRRLGRKELVIALISFIVPLIIMMIGIRKPFYIVNVWPAVFFYLMGSRLKDIQYNKTVSIVSCIVFLLSIFLPVVVDMRSMGTNCASYVLWSIASLFAIITFNNISKWMMKFLESFAIVGEKSLLIFVSHYPILILCKSILVGLVGVQSQIVIAIAMVIAMVVLFFFAINSKNRV